jgi:hypothetical protein
MKLTTLLYRSLISVLQCNYLYILHDRPKDGIMTTTQTKGEPLDTGILYAPSILSTGILLTSAKEQTDDTMADRYQGVGTKTNVWQAAKCIYELIRCGIEVRIPMLWQSFGRSSYSSSSSHFVFLLFPPLSFLTYSWIQANNLSTLSSTRKEPSSSSPTTQAEKSERSAENFLQKMYMTIIAPN